MVVNLQRNVHNTPKNMNFNIKQSKRSTTTIFNESFQFMLRNKIKMYLHKIIV